MDGLMKVNLLNVDNYFIQKSETFTQELAKFLSHYNELSQTLVGNYEAILNTMDELAKAIKEFNGKTVEFKDMQLKLGFDKDTSLIHELPYTMTVWSRLI